MISYSGYKRYITCPQYYKYHDIEKDRPGKKSSALLFGSIIDTVCNDILLGKTQTPIQDAAKLISQVKNEDIEFFPDDFDPDLVNIGDLDTFARRLGWKGKDVVDAIKTFLKAQDQLSDAQKQLVRRACWNSIQYKATCMIDSFIKWFLPKVDRVLEVQTHLVDQDRGIHGYLDFCVTLKTGERVLFDLKTSKMAYSFSAVTESPQLALYAAMKGYKYGGFVVLTKTLNKNKIKKCKPCGVEIEGGNTKNCPKCKKAMTVTSTPTSYCQILVDKIPQVNKDLTVTAIEDTIKVIKAGHFPRNLDHCWNHFGKHCPYVKKCWNK